jgi:hypothetical protein
LASRCGGTVMVGGGAKRRRIWTIVPTGKARSCRRRRPALAEKPGIGGSGRFGGKAGNRWFWRIWG